MSATTLNKPEAVPQYGGQALIEGVMMRGRDHVAVAVRRPDGQIVVHEQKLHTLGLKIPLLRGLAALFESLTIGTRALMWSAQVNAGFTETTFEEMPGGTLTTLGSLGMSAALMFAAPAIGSNWIEKRLGIKQPLLANLLEGAVRLAIVAGYITAVAQTREGHRLFQYHGAEHKTINAYEAGAPLTPESVKQFPLEHPRCGTAFLFTVVLINVLVNSLMGRPPLMIRVLLRLLLLPVIAGLAYEFIRFTAQHMDDPLVRVLIAPNLAMQRLTTREPDLKMLEVSIAALESVLSR
jgi:uncharacterized protein YqhQ